MDFEIEETLHSSKKHKTQFNSNNCRYIKTVNKLPDSKQEIELLLNVSAERAVEISNLKQGTDEWLQSRRPSDIGRFTGSTLCGLLGKNPYQNLKKSITEHISPTFSGNFLTKWGSDHEDHACDQFEIWLSRQNPNHVVKIKHFGLLIDSENPFLAYSPDGDVEIIDSNGLVTEKALLEIKCPGSLKYENHTSKDPIYGNHKWPNNAEGPVPIYYRYQMQLGCYILKRKFSYFAIWNPHQLQVSTVLYDEDYFMRVTLPLANDIFWNNYIPSLRKTREADMLTKKNWNARSISEIPNELNGGWFTLLETYANGGGIICLKDTGGSDWNNALVDHCTYCYYIPTNSTVCDMFTEESKLSAKTRIVRIYKTVHSKYFYLGEWLVDRIESFYSTTKNQMMVILTRSTEQSDIHAETYDLSISKLEGFHERNLGLILPSFKIHHEAEYFCKLHNNFIVNGEQVDDFESYTMDFMATDLKFRRICFDSKECLADLTETAKTKCRGMRDLGFYNVFIIIGSEANIDRHPSSPYFYYFGTSNETERIMCAVELQALLA